MNNRLGLIICGVAFSLAASGVALAADMAVKAPPPAPAPAPVSWTGWYAGLNMGVGWGSDDGINNTVTSSFCNPIFVGCFATPINSASTALAAGIPTQLGIHASGPIGGGQIGYNWQFAPQWVAGIEADFQGADISGSAAGATNTVKNACCSDSTIVTGTGSQKLDWFGTLRGRVGWLPTPPLLLYATGGLAYGHAETNTTFSGCSRRIGRLNLSISITTLGT